jgi:hypothetical protein
VRARQAVRYCSEFPCGECIPAHAFDSDGEVEVKHIFCAKCKGRRSTDDNDLVLCDGVCNRCGAGVGVVGGWVGGTGGLHSWHRRCGPRSLCPHDTVRCCTAGAVQGLA